MDESSFWAPGTVRLEQGTNSKKSVETSANDKLAETGLGTKLILHPVPTSDPNDPLNWSTARKVLNFGLVCFYVLWTFVQLDIGYTAWGPMQEELGFTFNDLNDSAAVNYGGLAIGCIFFVPFIHKYGRRPLYLFSSALQLASIVWQGKVNNLGDLIGSNIIAGLGGAISEAVVQITIADIFFVHQHGIMNGWYLMFTSIGAFLGPVASGYVVTSQGWRWIWWWCVIFMGLNLIMVVFFFEESKYIPFLNGRSTSRVSVTPEGDVPMDGLHGANTQKLDKDNETADHSNLERVRSEIDITITPKSYRQRMALVTASGGSIGHHFYQPVVVLFSFPAVAYAALTYGAILASFAIMTSLQAVYLLEPPYNFGAK